MDPATLDDSVDMLAVCLKAARRAFISSDAYARSIDRAAPDREWWERWAGRLMVCESKRERLRLYEQALTRAGVPDELIERHVRQVTRNAELNTPAGRARRAADRKEGR